MIDDAVNSLRKLFLASLGIVVLWVYVFPLIAETYRLYYDSVRDLHAWIQLKESLEDFKEYIFDVDPDQTIREIEREEIYSRRGDSGISPYSVMIKAIWPEDKSFAITLVPQNFVGQNPNQFRIYEINAVNWDWLPVSSYLAVFSFVQNFSGTFIVPEDDRNALGLDRYALRDIAGEAKRLNKPRFWRSTLSRHLLKYGFDGDPSELNWHNDAVNAFVAEADPATAIGAQVFGLQLSISAFFSAVGVFLATIAFAMIGPLRGIRGSGERETRQAWVMATPRGIGRMGTLLEGLVASASFIWAISPLIILLLQWKLVLEVERIPKTVLTVSSFGLIFSSAVFVVVALRLRHYREATAYKGESNEENQKKAASS